MSDGNELGVDLKPQIGIGWSPEGPFDWFNPADVPDKASLLDETRGKEIYFQTFGISSAEAKQLIEAKGYVVIDFTETLSPDEGTRVKTSTTYKFGRPAFRAIAKIGFNYLAHRCGPGFVLGPEFNEIRRFIFANVDTHVFPVHPLNGGLDLVSPQGELRTGHFLSLRSQNDRIECLVSLFGYTRYVVLLSDVPRLIELAFQGGGHLFDLEKREVMHLIAPTPLKIWHSVEAD